MTHVFQESLGRSRAQADAPWWEHVYRSAFRGFRAMVDVRGDGPAQRWGIDRQVFLDDGTTLKIDEKVRDGDWPDFALERWSDRDRRIAGWIQKPLTCDFIAYAFVESRRCYLLPYHTLTAAWRRFGREWVALAETGLNGQRPAQGRHRGAGGFWVLWAENRGYTTESIAVPREVLLASFGDVMAVDW